MNLVTTVVPRRRMEGLKVTKQLRTIFMHGSCYGDFMKGNSAPSKNGMRDFSRRAKYIFAVAAISEERGDPTGSPRRKRESRSTQCGRIK